MAQFPALPLFTDAYLGDTTHLTTLEHGAYLLLLITAWRAPECRLPNDDKMLCRFTKLSPAQWKRIKPILMEFFEVEDEHIYQKRLLDERDVVKRLTMQRSNAGKASALKRHNRDERAFQRKGNEKVAPTPTPTPTPTKEDKSTENEHFKIWYSHCPKKTGPEDAEKAYNQAIKSKKATHEVLLNAIIRYANEVTENGTERKYIKGPGAWIRAGRYNDEAAPPGGGNNGKSYQPGNGQQGNQGRAPTASEIGAAMDSREHQSTPPGGLFDEGGIDEGEGPIIDHDDPGFR